MTRSSSSERRFLLLSFAVLCVFPVQYYFRHFDDNTLVSWKWAFHRSDGAAFFLATLLAVIAAPILGGMTFPKRRPALFLFAFSFLASALFWPVPEVIIDASRYFLQARYLELNGAGSFFRNWGGELYAWTDLPLAPFLYGMVFRFLGEERLWIQVLNSAMFGGTAVAAWGIGKTLWDEEAGFLGGLLLSGAPYIFSQVPLMLVDVPAMFFSTLSLLAFLRALRGGGLLTLLLSAAAIVAVLLTKYSLWIWHGSALAVVVLVHLRGDEKRAVLLRAAMVAAAAGSVLALLLMAKGDVFISQADLLRSYQLPGLKRWGESHLSTFFFQIHPVTSLLAIISLLLGVWRKDRWFAVVAWLPLLLLVTGVGRIRYMIPAMPMIALAASYGLGVFRDSGTRRAVAWCAVILSLSVALFAYRPFLGNTSMANLQSAGRFLNSCEGIHEVDLRLLPRRSSVINIEVAVPILDYYTDAVVSYRAEEVPRPPRKKTEVSSYRFTWETDMPSSYRSGIRGSARNRALAIVSGQEKAIFSPEANALSEGYRRAAVFTSSTVFRFRTAVALYLPEGIPPEACRSN